MIELFFLNWRYDFHTLKGFLIVGLNLLSVNHDDSFFVTAIKIISIDGEELSNRDTLVNYFRKGGG